MQCKCGFAREDMLKLLVAKTCKIVCNNYTKDRNDEYHREKTEARQKRKRKVLGAEAAKAAKVSMCFCCVFITATLQFF
jgi:hypothetical protein